MAALDQEDPRNVAIRQNEADARYMRQTTPGERAMDQRAAFNEASLRQRSEAAAARLGMEQQRVNIAEGRAGLSELRMKIAEEKAKLAEADALSKAQRELTVMQEASGFLRDAVGMDPTKPSFDEQFQRMLAGYPNASESKSVKEWIDYHAPIALARRKSVAESSPEALKAIADTAAAKERGEGVKVTSTTLEGIDPETQKPYTQKRRNVTGSPEKVEQYEKTVTPPTGKAFLETLGIKPMPKKIKFVDGTPEG
jgi:hypothetical protein